MKVKKRKIILEGELAKKFGREHDLAVNSPAEAIRALCANHPEFYAFVAASEQRNVGYKVILDDSIMEDPKYIPLPFSNTMQIVPVIGGAKSGIVGVVLGAALLASSFFLPTAPLIGFLGASSPTLAGLAFGLGASMVLGGVSQILAPAQKSNVGQGESERPENKPSYNFNGPINTTSQGMPVPVGYGRMRVGSAVISAGITADDYTGGGVA